MGGKTKHAQRVKNNAKPSSSARSAELLGTTPTFVGFSAHSDLGIIPFAPGFTTVEKMPETFDSSISSQYQLTMKKFSKKDPMTKKKALQEFIDLINGSEIDELKMILPLWPKFYQNLATDPEHNVRELSQTVLQLLVSKCKKAVAPYLRQLVPVWLASQFDNYAPAASIASVSFSETFAGNANRTCEVCLHCQSEILEYTTRNLTLHTASTLSTGKNLSPEESEQKYQRVVICSLKVLSFFVKHTSEVEDQAQIQEGLNKLLDHQKFWTFAKNKLSAIRAAWFELIYHLLQYAKQYDIFATQKCQMIAIVFKNIDESDPLVAPHIWGDILLIQTNYSDWYATIDFETSVLPKFHKLLSNAFNRNAQAICPNILPFFSQLSQVTTDVSKYHKIVKQFFDHIKDVIVIEDNATLSISKQDNKIIIKTYFECLRYLIQQIYTKKENAGDEEKTLVLQLLEENIVEPIKWCLTSCRAHTIKNFFQHTSTLVAFFDKHSGISLLYKQLLDKFWSLLFSFMPEQLNKPDVSELYLERVIALINDLYVANPSLEEHKVKFSEHAEGGENVQDEEKEVQIKRNESSCGTSKEEHTTAAFIQKELKQLVLQLLRICLNKTIELKTSEYIKHIRLLCSMFNDKDFFAKISEDGKLDNTLNTFIDLLKSTILDNDACEVVVDILFEILQNFEKQHRFEIIEKELIKIPHHLTQTLILQRLLSHPLCVEPEVRNILSLNETTDIIRKIALEVVGENSKNLFNLLHKCFFQMDSGEILISSQAVDMILNILSESLVTESDKIENINTDIDACGSFIAQIMPVVCSNDNSSPAVKHKVFLRLFKFSLEKSVNDFISEDTLWEITTCWQDALSSEDIIIDENLLQKCLEIVNEQAMKKDLSITVIDSMAEVMAKFVICSTENIEQETERSLKIDKALEALLQINLEDIQDLYNVCLFIESLRGVQTPASNGFTGNIKNICDFKLTLQRSLLNFSLLCKLVCKPAKAVILLENAETNEDEITDDYCDPNANLLKIWSEFLQTQLLLYINIAGCGDALITHTDYLDASLEILCLELSEKVQLLLRNSGELSITLKERLLEKSAKTENIIYCRSLPYLINVEPFVQFDESSTLLLSMDLQEYFTAQKSFKAYINSLQYLLPKLEAKTISYLSSKIHYDEPSGLWIKAAVLRCLIINNFSSSYNDKSDHNIVKTAMQFITQNAPKLYKQKDLLLYQTEISNKEMITVLNAVEHMKLLIELLLKVPYELPIENWDVLRLGLAHWILSATKSLDYALENADQKTLYFILHAFKLYAALTKFFAEEKHRSSTELIAKVHDEWTNVFSRDVHLTIFKTFHRICVYQDIPSNFSDCWEIFLNELTPTMENMDYGIVYAFCKTSNQISLDHVCNFLLKNLSSSIHSLRTLSIFMMRQLTPHFVADDIKVYDKQSEEVDKVEQKAIKWHFLNRFEDYLGRYDLPIQKYIEEFSFKLTEINEMETINREEAFSYLMLWDCIINACAKSPVALRSVYTSWLHENKYEEHLLHFLFRSMPADILKNHSTKQLNNDIFKGLSWTQIKDPKLSLEKYVCHLYTDVLSKLPAVVRKWWNSSPSRQKTFVDTLTTNFVSPIICQEELMAIASKKEKHENMQVTVHISTREVLAVYSIDEARMELVITLAPNYPLGSVKVDCNKQIGGRSSSRNVAMQLTIFLTHQNGTIFDGLALWKNNLDKKFEGVEECYVCYTVIHQDTCQLPKLTCKTCKKKFHGPCLYKWFTTSSKSTCPICRNVF